MSVTPAVPYLLIGLAGCSVGRGISRGARKLTRTSTLIIIKKGHSYSFFICLDNTYLCGWCEYSNPYWLYFFSLLLELHSGSKKLHSNHSICLFFHSICLFFILRPCFFSYYFQILINYFNLKIVFSSLSLNFFHLSNLIYFNCYLNKS